jgi:hypothetical protein
LDRKLNNLADKYGLFDEAPEEEELPAPAPRKPFKPKKKKKAKKPKKSVKKKKKAVKKAVAKKM